MRERLGMDPGNMWTRSVWHGLREWWNGEGVWTRGWRDDVMEACLALFLDLFFFFSLFRSFAFSGRVFWKRGSWYRVLVLRGWWNGGGACFFFFFWMNRELFWFWIIRSIRTSCNFNFRNDQFLWINHRCIGIRDISWECLCFMQFIITILCDQEINSMNIIEL